MLDFFDYVYAEQTPHLEEQKAKYAEYLATFEDVTAESPDRSRQTQPAIPEGVH